MSDRAGQHWTAARPSRIGRAQDAWWAKPAFALLGPLQLEVTLRRIRRWARQDAVVQFVRDRRLLAPGAHGSPDYGT
jgi:hypothetical protein